jgi:hypothetical protein
MSGTQRKNAAPVGDGEINLTEKVFKGYDQAS